MKHAVSITWMMIVVGVGVAMGGWTPVTVPVDTHLRSISYISDEAVFVAGSGGTILWFDGDVWNVIPAITEKNLNAIAMITEEEGWAVGTEGLILRCVAGTWTIFPTEDEQWSYNDILAFGSTDVYIIGYNFQEGSKLLHWDGLDLTDMHTFSDNLTALDGTGPNDIWVTGGTSSIAHYDGFTWDTSMATFPETVKIFNMALTKNGQPVVTAVRLPGWDIDMILEYVPGTGWTTLWQGYEKRVMACDIAEMRGYALGSAGRIIERSIFGWQEIAGMGTRQINAVVLPDMANGWAVGDLGTVYRFMQPSINLQIANSALSAGTEFRFDVELINPGTAIENVMEIMFLEAYGMIFFWPTWSDAFAFEMVSLPENHRASSTVFTFEWPSGAGAGEAAFWGALLDSQSVILGYDIEPFSWQ
ncbi:hypothetical protein JXA80_13595 [bacterium]|nr:hypothetical protein [candidate division CSSED10-310 bacterium]